MHNLNFPNSKYTNIIKTCMKIQNIIGKCPRIKLGIVKKNSQLMKEMSIAEDFLIVALF